METSSSSYFYTSWLASYLTSHCSWLHSVPALVAAHGLCLWPSVGSEARLGLDWVAWESGPASAWELVEVLQGLLCPEEASSTKLVVDTRQVVGQVKLTKVVLATRCPCIDPGCNRKWAVLR